MAIGLFKIRCIVGENGSISEAQYHNQLRYTQESLNQIKCPLRFVFLGFLQHLLGFCSFKPVSSGTSYLLDLAAIKLSTLCHYKHNYHDKLP